MRNSRKFRIPHLATVFASALLTGTVLNFVIQWSLRPSFRHVISYFGDNTSRIFLSATIAATATSELSEERHRDTNVSSEFENDYSFNSTVFHLSSLSGNSDHLLNVGIDVICFKEGTESVQVSPASCRCKAQWHGRACSIPSSVYFAETPWNKNNLVLRKIPRRIIQAFPFNMEFEMLDIRLEELFDVVDAFLILESNFTAYGTHKDLHLLRKLEAGEYSKYARKIVHVFLDYFPEGAHKDGWIADGLHRNYIGSHGLRKISGWEATDLFVLTDADELPSRQTLGFLKYHDGYTEPVAINVHWFVFGFFWSPGYDRPSQPKSQKLFMCVTMGMLAYVFRYQVYFIRSAPRFVEKHQMDVKFYLQIGGRVGPWTIGDRNITTGWHCSWCVDPERIRDKLASAQNGDFPRWGDYPEKLNISYIESVVRRGAWFDEKSFMVKIDAIKFAPQSVLANRAKYSHLITNKYV